MEISGAAETRCCRLRRSRAEGVVPEILRPQFQLIGELPNDPPKFRQGLNLLARYAYVILVKRF